MKHRFLLVVELKTCRLSVDPGLSAPADGYVVSFMAFYEQGFGAPL
jgi:hypothetical protein